MDNLFVLRGLSDEQKEAIRGLFQHFDWDIDEMNPGDLEHPRDNAGNALPDNETGGDVEAEDVEEGGPDQPYMNDYRLEQDADQQECPHCFCRPCITDETHRQLWWETQDHPPDMENTNFRKPIYKRFWTMLLHFGVWDDPRYIERKVAALAIDPNHRRFRYHRRDIMPNCVLKLVRRWYPNQPNQAYMGHMWE